jgi:hypothetical protein
LSFDATVYFKDASPDLATKWEAALRELQIDLKVFIPKEPAGKGGSTWYLYDKADKKPQDGLAVHVKPFSPAEAKLKPDESKMLAGMRHRASLDASVGAGTVVLMFMGALAKAANGVMEEHQGSAFEKVFEKDLAAHRGAPGPKGQPTLVERGFYDATLAWSIAKAAAAYEERQKAKRKPRTAMPSAGGFFGSVALASFAKLVERRNRARRFRM